MNKKGYTLIELIAVVVIIALIATIVALNFDTIIGKTNTKKNNAFKDDLEKAACVYIDLQVNQGVKEACYSSGCSVTAEQLIISGLISDDLIDPTTNHEVNKSLVVNITWDSEGTKTCELNR